MPNHVEQDIVVTGKPEILKEFMKFAEDDRSLLSANQFIPYPEKFRRLDEEGEEIRKKCVITGDWSELMGFKDGFNSGGYEWCNENWGTKWGIYDAELLSSKLEGKTGKLKYTCRSAWSPAFPVFDAMSTKFPDLKFDIKYYEGGMGYKGHYVIKAGEILKDEEEKYSGSRGG